MINNVIFTYIEDNVSDEFKLFENMNTQKVELENIELIKNILIMNINNEELYKNENEIYNIFDEKILSHFTIKGKKWFWY